MNHTETVYCAQCNVYHLDHAPQLRAALEAAQRERDDAIDAEKIALRAIGEELTQARARIAALEGVVDLWRVKHDLHCSTAYCDLEMVRTTRQ